MLVVPEAFAAATRAREGTSGGEWVDALPAALDRLLSRWRLAVDGPVLHGHVALVVPVRLRSGRPAALKVSWIDDETRHEALALAIWDGTGAVQLLESAPDEGALLLERLDPHRSLELLDEPEAVSRAAALLRSLRRSPPAGLPAAADLARRWQTSLPREWERLGRPGRGDLVARAVEACAALAACPGPASLLHGDFHYGNVLARPSDADAAEEWVAIDPKPLVGDPEFDVLPLLRNRWDELAATGDAARACRRRLAAVVDVALLDRERAQRWCLARSVDDALLGHEQRADRFAAIAWQVADAVV